MRIDRHVGYCISVGDNHRNKSSTDISHGTCFSFVRREGGESGIEFTQYGLMSFSLRHIVYYFSGYGDFRFGIFAQRHPDGIAQAVGEQRSDTYSRFHSPVFTITCFGHTQMQRKMDIFLIHSVYQQTNGFGH